MKREITIEIDETKLASYTDKHLAMCWHVAQANPANGFADQAPGELAERVGREIIRRWLQGVPPELWHHQGRHYYWDELRRFAEYEPGGPSTDPVAFHSGRWVPRPGDADTADDPA